VARGDFAPEVRKMYASAMTLSASFTRDFNSFWGLGPDFRYRTGAST
jgi:acetone carboxylase alpha subunit